MKLSEIIPDVDVSNKSMKYMDKALSQYTKTSIMPEVVNRVIIHLYPHSDTTPDDREDCLGWVDSLFFTAKFYFPHNKTYISTNQIHDGIMIDKECTTKIFKDGSTLIVIHGPVKIYLSQCIDIASS